MGGSICGLDECAGKTRLGEPGHRGRGLVVGVVGGEALVAAAVAAVGVVELVWVVIVVVEIVGGG